MFGWWKKAEKPSAPTEERLEKVERGLRALSDDWEEFHDKVQRAVWRNAKRREQLAESDQLPTVAPEQPARHQLGRAPREVPEVDPVSAAILKRRGMRVVRDPANLNGGE
jgi:hypothetical protein